MERMVCMNTAHKLLIIIAAFVFTGCISSQALYFHERTKFGFSVQAKPEDPQEKLATHLGFKRQIIAIVPPKLVSKRTRNEIDGKPHTDETEGDKYHEGEALSLVSTFDVTANALKSIHIHNNFASGQAAKNLVDVSNEVYQDSKNVEAFRKFIADKKAEAKAAQNAGSSVVAPVRSDGFAPPAAAGKITEANYQKPYGHQLLLTKGRVTYEDKFAQTTTPLTAKEKEKDTCLNKLLSDEGKDCAMTWLGELAKNNKMDFIEALPIVENGQSPIVS